MVELLLSREGIQVNQADEDGYAPLIFAADKGHYKVVEMLLRKKDILVNQAGSRLVPLPPLHCSPEWACQIGRAAFEKGWSSS